MRFQGAVVREQGVSFAVVVVRRSVMDTPSQRESAIGAFRPYFPGLPIVLMAQDLHGRPKYFGRTDIVRFLSRVPFEAIPWREYQATA